VNGVVRQVGMSSEQFAATDTACDSFWDSRSCARVVAGNLISEEHIPNTCAALAVAGYVCLAPNISTSCPQLPRRLK
jgi:hypothetical protein